MDSENSEPRGSQSPLIAGPSGHSPLSIPSSTDQHLTSNRSTPLFKPPTEHGELFLFPPVNQWRKLWDSNRLWIDQPQPGSIDADTLRSWRNDARNELLELATHHSRLYSNSPLTSIDRSQPIVMTGHQPELYHPGVWVKNFIADRLAALFAATPINLVIDNDISGQPELSFLTLAAGKVERDRLELDAGDATLPFEERQVHAPETFASLCGRLKKLNPTRQPMLFEPLWGELRQILKQAPTQPPNLGYLLAAARHRLEQSAGLRTLEVPLSQVVDTVGFRHFFWQIASRGAEFRQTHNQALEEYRRTFKLRSRSHPVPDLGQVEGWSETPFWIWTENRPQRLPLFVLRAGRELRLSNRQGWETTIDDVNYLQQLAALRHDGIKIRPRALTTTWYARLILCDLFIHGTGGGRYDLLTNRLSQQFFQRDLPNFAVASATFKLYPALRANSENPCGNQLASATSLPPDRLARLARQWNFDLHDPNQIKQLYRPLDTQPEKILLALESATDSPPWDDQAKRIIAEKLAWVKGSASGSAAKRHQAIEECNRRLQPWISPVREELDHWLARTSERSQYASLLDSREYSFALFPPELVDDLQQLTRQIQ